MDEIVELSNADFYPPPEEKLIIVDVGDIFQYVEQRALWAGENPVHGDLLYDPCTTSFLNDLYDQISFIPNGNRAAAVNIKSTLEMCGQYFHSSHFTPLQQQLWYEAADMLLERFYGLKMYNERHENRYDFYAMHGDAMVLKLFE